MPSSSCRTCSGIPVPPNGRAVALATTLSPPLTGLLQNPRRHAGLVPASTSRRPRKVLILRHGGPRNKSGVTEGGAAGVPTSAKVAPSSGWRMQDTGNRLSQKDAIARDSRRGAEAFRDPPRYPALPRPVDEARGAGRVILSCASARQAPMRARAARYCASMRSTRAATVSTASTAPMPWPDPQMSRHAFAFVPPLSPVPKSIVL